MPQVSRFKRLDVRPLIARGEHPMTHVRAAVEGLHPDQGLMLVAPFLPAPLIEMLGSEGFEFRCEPGRQGDWLVYFWRTSD